MNKLCFQVPALIDVKGTIHIVDQDTWNSWSKWKRTRYRNKLIKQYGKRE